MIRHQKNNRKRNILLAIILLLTLAAGGYAVMNYLQRDDTYAGPTPEEQASGNERKHEITESESQHSPSQTNTNSGSTELDAAVIITYAEQVGDVIEVNAYTKHYAEGTCTIRFTNGSYVVERQTPAHEDATTTICTNPLIERSAFPVSGSWNVEVIYQTGGKSSKSNTLQLDIR